MKENTVVVNIRKEKCDIYIGRIKNSDEHFGNPFAITPSTIATSSAANLDESLNSFLQWLKGENHQEIEPHRRSWILNNISRLKGKRIGCFCRPRRCHGDVYRILLGEADKNILVEKEASAPDIQGSLF